MPLPFYYQNNRPPYITTFNLQPPVSAIAYMVTDVESKKSGQPLDVSTQQTNHTPAVISAQNLQGVEKRFKYIRAHFMELKFLT